MNEFDVLAGLQIVALIGLLIGYRKANRNVMLICGAAPAVIVVALWVTYSYNESVRALKDGYNSGTTKR